MVWFPLAGLSTIYGIFTNFIIAVNAVGTWLSTITFHFSFSTEITGFRNPGLADLFGHRGGQDSAIHQLIWLYGGNK